MGAHVSGRWIAVAAARLRDQVCGSHCPRALGTINPLGFLLLIVEDRTQLALDKNSLGVRTGEALGGAALRRVRVLTTSVRPAQA